MNTVEAKEALLSVDENSVLQYLNNYPDDFVTEMEITRHADGRSRFLQDKHWAHTVLFQLVELRLVDTDGSGRYKLHPASMKKASLRPKFLAPTLRDILEHSDHKLDLSGFA